jgi:hypothetical protein
MTSNDLSTIELAALDSITGGLSFGRAINAFSAHAITGSLTGAMAGGYVGGVFGSAIAGFGAVPGAFVGGMVGGSLGAVGGGLIGVGLEKSKELRERAQPPR